MRRRVACAEWLLPVPVLTPRLSSYWVHLVTPIPASVARPLIEGLRNEVIVRDPSARDLFPQIKPMDYHTAVSLALADLEARHVETSWSDALVNSQGDIVPAVAIHPRRDAYRQPTANCACSSGRSFQGDPPFGREELAGCT